MSQDLTSAAVVIGALRVKLNKLISLPTNEDVKFSDAMMV